MAVIFDIERFSLNDGPGIRTTVFLKGCPLKCPWCHNPESKSFRPQLSYNKDLCILCGKCAQVCQWGVHHFEGQIHIVNHANCTACGKCTQVCCFNAVWIYGKEMTPTEVVDVVIKDKTYYDNSGGGVTVSGGEPLCFSDFTAELFTMLKKQGVHTCVETAGAGKQYDLKKLIPLTDLFLFDFKANKKQYPSLIGIDFQVIYDNLVLLNQSKANVRLRLPMIPFVNDDDERMEEVIELSQMSCIQEIEMMPYHDIGKGKAQLIGVSYPENFTIPQSDIMEKWKQRLAATGKLLST